MNVRARKGGMTYRVRWSRPVHCAILLIVHAELLLHPTRAGEWDWRFSFYPQYEAVRRTVLQYGEFPWWNPWMRGGMPLFADPEIAVVSPDTLLVLGLGVVPGLKAALLLYAIIGYEGVRALLRHLFRDARTRGGPAAEALVAWFAIVPALVPALAGCLVVGYYSFVAFHLFPWLLLLALTWIRGRARATALGAVAGCLMLTYLHYMAIMALTIAGAAAMVALVRHARRLRTWGLAALAVTTAGALALTRVAVSVQWLTAQSRPDLSRPMALRIDTALASLIWPFRPPRVSDIVVESAGLGWPEVGCYVGVFALLAAVLGLRRAGRWTLRWWHALVPVLLVLAWNNRDPWLPAHWLGRVPPWSYMLVPTRWRLFAALFLLVAAVGGLLSLHAGGRRRAAWVLGLVIVIDLGVQIGFAWHGRVRVAPPPVVAAPDPPITVRSAAHDFWAALRRNEVCLNAPVPVMAFDPETARVARSDPGYRGEIHGEHPGDPPAVAGWSPNGWRIEGQPGDRVTVNVNPGNYWTADGVARWGRLDPVEPMGVLRVALPTQGTVVLRARPPGLWLLMALQVACALMAIVPALTVGRERSGPA